MWKILRGSMLVKSVAPIALLMGFQHAFAAPAQLDVLETDPGAIVENNPTDIYFTVKITDTSVIKSSVNVQVIDENNKITLTYFLYDDGTHGDKLSNDGVFTGHAIFKKPPDSVLRLRASAGFRGLIKRVFSPVTIIAVLPSLTIMNASRDFSGDNMGPQIYLHWNDVPDNVAYMRLYRGNSNTGPWTLIAQQLLTIDSPFNYADNADGSLQDWYYKLEVYDGQWNVLKTFDILRVPKDAPPCPASSSAAPWNGGFITNQKFTDTEAMSKEQIAALLKYYGSVLSKQGFADNDGVIINPSELIYAAANQHGINPQVLLATLQKESSLVKSSQNWAKPPKDGYFGVKVSGCTTFRCQLNLSAKVLADAYNAALGGGTTKGGWEVGVGHIVDYSSVMVTPANAATASLFNYTPVVGSFWYADTNLGTSGFVNIWENSLFSNLVFSLKWETHGLCEVIGNTIYVGGNSSYAAEDVQPSGINGASALLPGNNSYKVRFTYDLNTWDSYNSADGLNTGYWDSFSVSVLDKQYWDEILYDPVQMQFVWGGTHYGDYSSNKSSSNAFATINSTSMSTNYLNAVVDTATLPEADSALPSWGFFDLYEVKSTGACVHINDTP